MKKQKSRSPKKLKDCVGSPSRGDKAAEKTTRPASGRQNMSPKTVTACQGIEKFPEGLPLKNGNSAERHIHEVPCPANRPSTAHFLLLEEGKNEGEHERKKRPFQGNERVQGELGPGLAYAPTRGAPNL